jgi:hypothetical protein
MFTDLVDNSQEIGLCPSVRRTIRSEAPTTSDATSTLVQGGQSVELDSKSGCDLLHVNQEHIQDQISDHVRLDTIFYPIA